MHIAVAVLAVLLACFRGDWSRLRDFLPTIQYLVICNLFYNFITGPNHMWRYEPDFLINHTLTDTLHTFVTLPALILVYLSRFPKHRWRAQARYLAGWVLSFAVAELIFYHMHRLSYHNGWNYGYSIALDTVMFCMLRFYYIKPYWTYGLSVVITFLLIVYFRVPVLNTR